MASKKYGSPDLDFIESGNWNVAEDYSQVKIMKPLREFDEYRNIAKFGSSNIIEDFTIEEEIKNESKIKALKRMHELLKIIIDNSCFAINKKNDLKSLEEYRKLLDIMDQLLPYSEIVVIRESTRGNRRIVTINEKVFNHLFTGLTQIHFKMLFHLNNNDLIYTSREIKTVEEIKEEIKRRAIEQG